MKFIFLFSLLGLTVGLLQASPQPNYTLLHGSNKVHFNSACWIPDTLKPHTQLRLQKDSIQFEIIEINPQTHQLKVQDPSLGDHSERVGNIFTYGSVTGGFLGFTIASLSTLNVGYGTLAGVLGAGIGFDISFLSMVLISVVNPDLLKPSPYHFSQGSEAFALFKTCENLNTHP